MVGDRDLPGIEQPEEESPFLGWRGIRMSLDAPALFKPRLGAILRAALGNLKVMFPMVADVEELRAAKKVLSECEDELKGEGAEIEPVGVMVEAAGGAGIWVRVCGEAAADTALIPRPVEPGVAELSMSPPSIPRAKKIVSEL